ncbi:Vigilin 1 [Cyphellophora attinorum]|uniref:Vigilin 1 n=1 Tax=Cyphellophora attinorum TaxID=1664694 RepID=A0A0N0NMC8_9EURO|nr:Vigilin 1 [Phialophora attinorum]KPI40059.1 Vigilin 1 [Phialophora attinorum]
MSSNEVEASSSGKTPAQLMQEQHEAAESHRPTVEDVVDEEDIEHPPPSASYAAGDDSAATNGTSSKAAGKQKASEMVGAIDTQDEEAFPALGSNSKAPAVPRATGWGAAAAKATKPSGPSSQPGSGKQTPATATPRASTPVSTAASSSINLPGRSRDKFIIPNSEIDKTKPRQKVFVDVKKKFNVIVTEKPTGNEITFTAEGPTSKVTPALMYISEQLTVEKVKKLEIPSSATAQIIGAKGANIKKLQEKHGVNINVRQKAGAEADDNGFASVEVKGHAAQVAQACDEISRIAKQHEKPVTVPLTNIPPEFFPFIAGRNPTAMKKFEDDNDIRIEIPAYHSWRSQAPAKTELMDNPPDSYPMARAKIESMAERMQNELVVDDMPIEQFMHPFIVGERGIDPLEFFEKTRCMVITPPSHHETEEVHIIGPQDSLADARRHVEEIIARKQMRQFGINKQFQDSRYGAQRHSRGLAQYLQRKAIEREFLKKHRAEIIFPSNAAASPDWTIITDEPSSAIAARTELASIAGAFPTARIQLVEVDPFFHSHIQQQYTEKLQNDHGVHMFVLEDDDGDSVVLVYEGPQSDESYQIPRSKPSKAEIAEYERALAEAEGLLRSIIPPKGISQRDFSVASKYHDRVRRFVQQEQQPVGGFPVHIDFNRNRPSGPRDQSNRVFLRHPEDAALEELQRKIEEFLIQAEQDEKERGHTITVPFQAKHKSQLIGSKGKFVKSLREKYDVNIQVGDEKSDEIQIIGPPKKAEACKAEVLKLHKAWADEVTYYIKIDPKFHGQLVGRNGENLRKIQARADDLVRIDFPRQSRGQDDASDVASDAGSTRRATPPDQITIRGPKAKADAVRDELLSYKQYLEDNSHSASVSVAQDQVASLIGRGGSELNKMRTDTGAEIDVPKANGADRVTITIRGSKSAVAQAKEEISKRAKAFDSIVTRTIDVDRKHHGALIGGGGANIQAIVAKAGGTGQSAEHVRFPNKSGEQSSTLTVKGTQAVADAIVKQIHDFVSERENQVIEVVDVPLRLHSNLIGPGGANRSEFEKKHGVQMNVPHRNDKKTGVKLTGAAEKVAAAKESLLGLVDSKKGETITVPRKYHHAVAQNGATFGELKQMGIRVDHGGAKTPAKPKAKTNGESTTNGALPLITDQGSSETAEPVWELVSLNSDEEGDIIWELSSTRNDADLARAKARIQALLESATTPRFTGYLTLADPQLHRRIIGQRGEKIDGMRKVTGCDIQVPKRGGGGSESITITGGEEGVLQAKQMILEAVNGN